MRKYFRKAQTLIEYLIIGVISIGIILSVFTILFKDLSDNVVKSAPAYSENSCIKMFSNLATGKDSSYFSDEAVLNLINFTGDNGGKATHINNVIPAECADKIDFPVSDYECVFDIAKQTCEIDCTIYTSSNELLDEIRKLVEAGTINPNLLVKAQEVPFSEIPSGTIQDIFEKYYLVGTETEEAYLNFKHAISLTEYLSSQNILPADLKDLYDQLLVNIKDSTTCTLVKVSESTTINYSTWETEPEYIGEEVTSPSIPVPPSASEPPPPPKPKYTFCSHKKSYKK